jgi:8-oxo-dGTP diphosphatase
MRVEGSWKPGSKIALARSTLKAFYRKGFAEESRRIMQREFPEAPLVGVGAVVVDEGRVLLVRRGTEPLKGDWSLPGGVLELGESLLAGVVREVREETGLTVEPIGTDRVAGSHSSRWKRVRYHYVIADYLCRVAGGELQAASDADAVRWVERAEWNSHSALKLDPVTVRVIELGWQRALTLRKRARGTMKLIKKVVWADGAWLAVVAGIGFWLRPVSYLNQCERICASASRGRRKPLGSGCGPSRALSCRRAIERAGRWCWCMGWAGARRTGATWRPGWRRPVFASICRICRALGAVKSLRISPIRCRTRLHV